MVGWLGGRVGLGLYGFFPLKNQLKDGRGVVCQYGGHV